MDIYDFLTRLSTDPLAQRQFADDPEAVMAAAGLRPEHQAILASRDMEALHRAVAPGPWQRSTAFADPSYDPPPLDEW